VDDADEWIEGVARSMVIPAGDVVRVEFELPWMPTERAVAELPYTDIADGPLRRTRLLITTNSDPESWEVAGFALYDGPPRSRPKLLSGPWRDEDGVAD
jgi:hypothetical protein